MKVERQCQDCLKIIPKPEGDLVNFLVIESKKELREPLKLCADCFDNCLRDGLRGCEKCKKWHDLNHPRSGKMNKIVGRVNPVCLICGAFITGRTGKTCSSECSQQFRKERDKEIYQKQQARGYYSLTAR